jgi:NADPH-dependent ferric siderophore reductase
MIYSAPYEHKEITVNTDAPRSRAPYLIEVAAVRDITPHLRRITFSAPDLRYYPAQAAAAHIKIFLPLAGQPPNVDR